MTARTATGSSSRPRAAYSDTTSGYAAPSAFTVFCLQSVSNAAWNDSAVQWRIGEQCIGEPPI